VRAPLRAAHPGVDAGVHVPGRGVAAVSRLAQGMVMVLLGAAALSVTVASQAYLNYVREEFRPFLVAAGVALVLLGAVTTALELRAAPEDGQDGPPHGHSHGHDHAQAPAVAWLLLAP